MNIHAWRVSILDDETLSFNAKGIGMMLCMFYRPGSECFPSQDTLQSKCNLGSENTLKKGLKELEQHGYISRTKKYLPGKTHYSVVYEFAIPAVQVSNNDTRQVSRNDTRTGERVSENDTRQVSRNDTRTGERVSENDTGRVSERVSNPVSKFDTEYREHREIDVVVENTRGEKQQPQQRKFFIKGKSDAWCEWLLENAREQPDEVLKKWRAGGDPDDIEVVHWVLQERHGDGKNGIPRRDYVPRADKPTEDVVIQNAPAKEPGPLPPEKFVWDIGLLNKYWNIDDAELNALIPKSESSEFKTLIFIRLARKNGWKYEDVAA